MTLHTFSENIYTGNAFSAAAMTNSTQSGSGIDTQQQGGGPFRRAAVVANLNPGAATTANIQVQDSPDNSTWTSISNATLGTAIAASTAAQVVVNIDLAKRQRYLRVQVIGTGTAGAAAADLFLFEGEYLAPIQATATTVLTV